MILAEATVGSLNLISIELEQMIKAINLYILLFILLTLFSYLLADNLEFFYNQYRNYLISIEYLYNFLIQYYLSQKQ